jgi:MFS family permease
MTGWLADRYGGRPIVIASLAVMALGTIAVAAVSSVIGLVVLYGLVISFASGGISPATTGVIVVRWFKKRRGMAMSVLVAGGSVGGLIVESLERARPRPNHKALRQNS